MRSDTTQRDLYRDDPRRHAQLWRIQAETWRAQLPHDEKQYRYYINEAERLERQARPESTT